MPKMMLQYGSGNKVKHKKCTELQLLNEVNKWGKSTIILLSHWNDHLHN